jgi:hypothetical protein
MLTRTGKFERLAETFVWSMVILWGGELKEAMEQRFKQYEELVRKSGIRSKE